MNELKTVFRSVRLTPTASDLIEKSDDVLRKYGVNDGNLMTIFFEKTCHDHNRFEMLVRFFTLLGLKNNKGEAISHEMLMSIAREVVSHDK